MKTSNALALVSLSFALATIYLIVVDALPIFFFVGAVSFVGTMVLAFYEASSENEQSSF